ncbi:Non-ribosomal peptide synthetase [Beggiatoa sp. SS]|nr:Non-ribosomal peptide synthetase [Beggiatoa sp. SS]
MTTLAAFAVVVGRYTGQEQFVIGSPIANRHYQELESLIGFFVNTLALPIDLRDEPSFLNLLQQVRQTTLEAYAHQDFPFERLVDVLKLERDMSRNPLVQVMFAVQNAPMEPLALSDLTLTPVDFGAQAVRFDLEVHLWESDETLTCHVLYYQDLFEPATIERMLAHFETVLKAVVASAQRPVHSYPLLTQSEIQQLQAWNQTKTDYPKDKTVVALFEEQVVQNPSNLAVVFEGDELSYQELNDKSNQLAHYLLKHPTLENASNPLIAICVERSLEMVIGVLGILKAGGAYVPIDPNYPSKRIAYLLKDSGAPLLLTQTALKVKLPLDDSSVIAIDEADFCLPSNPKSKATKPA